jgi:hypothetical protein
MANDWRTNMMQAQTAEGVVAYGNPQLMNGVRDWETHMRNAWTKDGLKIVGIAESGWIISGQGSPDIYTVGRVGTIYIDTETGNKYECTGTEVVEGITTYIWTPFYMPVKGIVAEGSQGWVCGDDVWKALQQNVIFREF